MDSCRVMNKNVLPSEARLKAYLNHLGAMEIQIAGPSKFQAGAKSSLQIKKKIGGN